MIGPGTRTRVFAYAAPCDMRKSFNTLSGLVTAMGHELAAGDAFLFVGRNKRRAKVVWYDGTGLCLLAKRLDQGRFVALWEQGTGEVEMTLSELRLFLEGCQVVGRMPLSPPPIDITRASRVGAGAFG
jgi:transposase